MQMVNMHDANLSKSVPPILQNEIQSLQTHFLVQPI